MPVSLVKELIPASNARNTRVRLGAIPVRVTNVIPEQDRPGYVLVLGLTVNGAVVGRSLTAGHLLAAAPDWAFRHRDRQA